MKVEETARRGREIAGRESKRHGRKKDTVACLLSQAESRLNSTDGGLRCESRWGLVEGKIGTMERSRLRQHGHE